jgi:hypothetical protein
LEGADMSEMTTEVVILPASGEQIDLNDLAQVCRAFQSVKEIESQLREAKGVLRDAVLHHSSLLGSKTMHVAGGGKVEVKGGTVTQYDAESIETDLRAAGMPEERIREIVVETVTYSVKAAEAKKAASANPVYAEIIARHRQVFEARATVSVS